MSVQPNARRSTAIGSGNYMAFRLQKSKAPAQKSLSPATQFEEAPFCVMLFYFNHIHLHHSLSKIQNVFLLPKPLEGLI